MGQYKQLLQFSASEISDALDSLGIDGGLLRINSITPGLNLVGPIYTVSYEPYPHKPVTFNKAADYIDDIPEGAVVLVDNNGIENCTVWGNILTATAIKKQLAGTIVLGMVRDIHHIKTLNYPVFALGSYMKSGKNRVRLLHVQKPIHWEHVTIHPHDYVFADDHGVLIIPKHLLHEVVQRAQAIKKTEEKIVKFVEEGSSLKNARLKYHYHQPWSESDNV
tara:strand:- start:1515 stop:2177 length:663 start_codon:yes stop_codon:yes gene_type:complete